MDCKETLTTTSNRARLCLVILLVALAGVTAILPTLRSQQPVSTAAKSEPRRVAVKATKPEKGELVRAVIRGDEEAVRSLLRNKADPNENLGTEEAPLTPLFAAVALREQKISLLLLARSANLDLERTYQGYNALDYASFWEQDSLMRQLASEMASAPKEDKATLDLDRMTWVANGLAALSKNQDHGTALGLSYIVAAYQKRGAGNIARDEVLKQAVRLQKEYEKQIKAGKADSPNLAQLATIAFQTIEDKKLASRIAQEIVGVSLYLSETPLTSTAYGTMRSMIQHGLVTNRFHEKTLQAAYLLGKNEPNNAGWVVNEFAGKRLNANLTDKADTIIRRNTTHFHPVVLTLVRSDTPHTKQAIAKSWGQVFQDIRKANAASIEVLKRIDRAERDAVKEFEQQQTFAALESSVYLLKTFASFENPKLAHQIATVGAAGIQIGKAISTFVAAGAATLASSVTLVGGVVLGVMMIASLFDSGPSAEQIILDQITELRQQVEEVRQQMHERFDAVDRRLEQMFKLMIHGFQSLSIDLALARDEIRSVAIQLSLMESNLLDLEPNVRSYIEVGVDRDLWRKVGRYLDWQKHETGRLPYSDFSSALDALRQAATREAKDLLSVGRSLTKEELEDDSKLAARFLALSKDGLDCNIGLMQSIARRFDHDGAFSRARLANPMRWAMMVEVYVQLASQYPDYYYKQTTATGVDEMLQIGKEWQEAVRSLKNVRTGEASKDSATLYLRLLNNYKVKVDQLRSVVRERVQKYQIENVEGYDLWAGTQQAPRSGSRHPAFGITEIPASEDFDFSKAGPPELAHWKGGRQLSAPSQLSNPDSAKAVIDPALLIAHHLGLGEIKVRWTAPNWDEVRRPMHKPDEDHIYGKAGLTFQATFKENDGKNRPNPKRPKILPLFKRRLNSGQDFHYGIEVFNMSRHRNSRGSYLSRTTVKWTHLNRMIDPAKEVLLQSAIQRHWPGMRDRVFQGIDRIPPYSILLVSQLVRAHFRFHCKILERELRGGAKGSDSRLVDAMRQLTAAKAMLDAFVSLGMAKSLTEKAELRDLLSGEKMTKGQTRLLDGRMLETVAAHHVTPLLEATRDAEWLDGPAKKLEAYFRSMPDSSEPQPLIEATMERLMLLKKMHESAQPKQTLSQAARELKRGILALGQR